MTNERLRLSVAMGLGTLCWLFGGAGFAQQAPTPNEGPVAPFIAPPQPLAPRSIAGSQAIWYLRTSEGRDVLWPDAIDIPVCWEPDSAGNLPAEFETERAWVRSQVTSSWQEHSALRFTGWGGCSTSTSSRGIHIQVGDDEHPRVETFGSAIDGIPNGVHLNFRYTGPSARVDFAGCLVNERERERCIRGESAHEFGHALGFRHEQARGVPAGHLGRPHCRVEELNDGPPGEYGATPEWDLGSIMNYCNPVRNNDGNLSDVDIRALQSIYGIRQQQSSSIRRTRGGVSIIEGAVTLAGASVPFEIERHLDDSLSGRQEARIPSTDFSVLTDIVQGVESGDATINYNAAGTDRYVGPATNWQPNGRGVRIYPNGDRYSGDFLNGQITGYGAMHFGRGQAYDGQWLNGHMNGEGYFRWPSGSWIRGPFSQGNPLPNGVCEISGRLGRVNNVGHDDATHEFTWNCLPVRN